MRNLAILVMLGLQILVCSCGTSPYTTNTITNTTTNGDWEAQLIGGTQQASLLNFVTAFIVTNAGPLDITGFSFFNAGSCFGTGVGAQTVNGTASFTTSNADQVTGTLTLTISSTSGATVLKLNGQLTGTSNATISTTGTLSNGVVVGTWTLTPGANATNCNQGTGTFLMCQGASTCTPPTSAERPREADAILTEHF